MFGRGRLGRFGRLLVFAAAVLSILAASTSIGRAQLEPLFPTPSPTTTPKPAPSPTPGKSPAPSSDPVPSQFPVPVNVTPTPEPEETDEPVKKDVTKDALDAVDEKLDDELDDFSIPVLARTRPRNTVALVDSLRPLTELGIPLEQVLIDGMGRFPVAGLAHYFDDWLNPRFTPKPHLHHGLDIFADFGTPIRSPERGVVSQLSNHGAGGIAVWTRGAETGNSYYFAHMLERVEGIRVGQRVDVGSVLGYVGDTGNAQGGTPHLHFEIHPGGGEAVPPKPTVDAWLDEAEARAGDWVEAFTADVKAKRRILGSAATATASAPNKELEASMLLTLLDPVGGSVGMLPSLELGPRRGGAVSDRLLSDLISSRVEGRLFAPTDKLHLRD